MLHQEHAQAMVLEWGRAAEMAMDRAEDRLDDFRPLSIKRMS